PAGRAGGPALGSGAASRRAAGRGCLIGRRCRTWAAAAALARARAADPGRARVRERRPADRRRAAGTACLHRLEGASPARPLPSWATVARAGTPLGALAAG